MYKYSLAVCPCRWPAHRRGTPPFVSRGGRRWL